VRIVPPDFARRIELHGVGACPRPVDIGKADHDFATLVSLRVYSFAGGMVIHGDAEEDEVYVVLMRGTADVAVTKDGVEAGRWSLDPVGGIRAVYLPPLSSYRLTATAECNIAYARAVPAGRVPLPAGFATNGGRVATDHATRMTMTLAPVVAGGQGAAMLGGERFVHLRGHGAGTLAAAPVGDWDSVLLDEGEDAALVVGQGMLDVLTIGAKAR
jgi:5-deoxy-D-glucuronate isomerase